MPERTEKILRLVCLLLGALLAFQVLHLVLRRDGLAHLNIPALPTLAGDTNAPVGTKDEKPKGESPGAPLAASSGTNATNVASKTKGPTGTNATNVATAAIKGTKSSMMPEAERTNTNNLALKTLGITDPETNSTPLQKPETSGTNALTSGSLGTNGTNLAAAAGSQKKGTNAILMHTSGTNGTNLIADQSSTNKATNAPGLAREAKKGPNSAPRAGGKSVAPELPPPIQARVDKIIQSEILGQIMRPMPMALLGIAGRDVFLRAPNGQTGLVKEGDELGGVKLLQIGINRVLVEEDGQKKELTLFSGLGSQSLLSDTNSTPK